ncbi:hypothetical protein [Streptomyces sp. TRM68367]|uniref:hypothetical protein n=1 Tax=Streptomyces sp. TRM68367 TaxID=2758415 RepID=UPI00165C0645|nr:hypothetical protein [Streptomyces sp. TRM68367]MBC9725941.1 hypothetical protein [Streptomyces sp. TRM68367]
MPHLRTRIAAVIAASLLAATATGAAVSAAAAAPHRPAVVAAEPHGGIAYLPSNFDLQPLAPNSWHSTGLQVTLPEAGTYDLDLDVRGLVGAVPPVTAWVSAQLYNVTDSKALPDSDRLVAHLREPVPAPGVYVDNQRTAPMSERITVDKPTTIRLEARRTGATTASRIMSDSNGKTSFRYERVLLP